MERNNFKNYLLYSLKKQLPFFFVLLFAMGIPYITYTLTSGYIFKSAYIYDSGYIYPVNPGFVFFFMIAVPAFVCSMYAPIYVYSYRYKKGSGDTFRQLPVPENGIRKARLLTALIYLAISFTAVFIAGAIILAIRQTFFVPHDVVDSSGQTTRKFFSYWYNYGFFPLIYLGIAAFMGVEFFISSLVCKNSNSVLDAFVHNILFMLLRALIFFIPVLFVSQCIVSLPGELVLLTPNFSPVQSSVSLYYIFRQAVTGEAPLLNITRKMQWILIIGGMVAYLAVGVLCAIYSFDAKEPTGEINGRPTPQNKYVAWLPHIAISAYMIFSTLLVSSTGLMSFIIFIQFVNPFGYFLEYYLLMALVNRTFKIKKAVIKKMAIVTAITIGIMLVICILAAVVNPGSEGILTDLY